MAAVAQDGLLLEGGAEKLEGASSLLQEALDDKVAAEEEARSASEAKARPTPPAGPPRLSSLALLSPLRVLTPLVAIPPSQRQLQLEAEVLRTGLADAERRVTLAEASRAAHEARERQRAAEGGS